MEFHQIKARMEAQFGQELIKDMDDQVQQPWLEVDSASLAEVALFLRDEADLGFDFLNNLSGVDYGPDSQTLGVTYHLSSLIHEHHLVLKVKLDRANPEPVPSLAAIWRTAEWHEREAYDLVGIPFENHPDLRRILMPADWEGHPLRKDYQAASHYHGVAIDYEEAQEEGLKTWDEQLPNEQELPGE
ncbi:MAG: NADH-quinone oxidoreductase subunit C [Bacteroidota bacterium]